MRESEIESALKLAELMESKVPVAKPVVEIKERSAFELESSVPLIDSIPILPVASVNPVQYQPPQLQKTFDQDMNDQIMGAGQLNQNVKDKLKNLWEMGYKDLKLNLRLLAKSKWDFEIVANQLANEEVSSSNFI